MRESVCIIGSLPPPIGGVTIHTSRLKTHLESKHFPHDFLQIRSVPMKRLLMAFFRYPIIHIHSSSPYVRLFTAVLGKCTKTKTIATYHGNLGRFSNFKNWTDRVSIKWMTVPVVINEKSFQIASKLNSRTKLISAFIEPQEIVPLPTKELNELLAVKSQQTLMATNAYNVSYDKEGNEIYGITELLKLFRELEGCRLIISDPSGNYRSYIENTNPKLLREAYWINFEHDFMAVLDIVDGFIRNTTTDGDSLSVHEALSLGKAVYATNVVDRPKGCRTYTSISELKEELLSGVNQGSKSEINTEKSVVEKLIEIYKEMIA